MTVRQPVLGGTILALNFTRRQILRAQDEAGRHGGRAEAPGELVHAIRHHRCRGPFLPASQGLHIV